MLPCHYLSQMTTGSLKRVFERNTHRILGMPVVAVLIWWHIFGSPGIWDLARTGIKEPALVLDTTPWKCSQVQVV